MGSHWSRDPFRRSVRTSMRRTRADSPLSRGSCYRSDRTRKRRARVGSSLLRVPCCHSGCIRSKTIPWAPPSKVYSLFLVIPL